MRLQLLYRTLVIQRSCSICIVIYKGPIVQEYCSICSSVKARSSCSMYLQLMYGAPVVLYSLNVQGSCIVSLQLMYKGPVVCVFS